MSSNSDVRPKIIEKEDDSSDYSEDCLSNYRVMSVNSKVQELQQAFEKFKHFIDQLSGDKAEALEKELIVYSDKESILSKCPHQISKLCEKRIQKMLRNKKTKKNWNQNDIDILVWVLNKYSSIYAQKSVHSLEKTDWKFISSLIPATSWKKCMFKWLSLKKFSLMTFKWSREESQLLANLVKKYGKKDWKKLSEELYMSNGSSEKIFRTPKQCREHWNCYANPAIKKGPWASKEDIKLLESVLQLNCMKKWSEVAKNIKGRTQNAVKNRFSLLLDKQRKETGEENQKHLINRILFNLMNEDSIHHHQIQMRSEQLDQIHAPHQIFEQQSLSSVQNQSKGQEALQKRTSSLQEQQKKQDKTSRNIVIPTFTHNQATFPQPQYFPVCPEFTPYFFNVFYGGHYQMN